MSAKRNPSKAMPVRRLCEVKMKKVLLAIALAAWAGQSFAYSGNDLLNNAQVRERLITNRQIDGDTWVKAGVYLGFVQGVAFTLGDIDPRVCLPSVGGNTGQYAAVVKQYLEQNPAQLHRPAHNLVHEALQRAFPCR